MGKNNNKKIDLLSITTSPIFALTSVTIIVGYSGKLPYRSDPQLMFCWPTVDFDVTVCMFVDLNCEELGTFILFKKV